MVGQVAGGWSGTHYGLCLSVNHKKPPEYNHLTNRVCLKEASDMLSLVGVSDLGAVDKGCLLEAGTEVQGQVAQELGWS